MGAGVGCLLSWLKKFKCWFSLSTLSISLFTGAAIINPLFIHFSCSQAWELSITLHIICLLSKVTSWMKTYRPIMTVFHNFLADRNRPDNFNSFVVWKHREVGPSIDFSPRMSWHKRLRKQNPKFAWVTPVCTVPSLRVQICVFGLLTCLDLQMLFNRCFCGPGLWLVQCVYKAVYLNNCSVCVCVC